MKISTKNTVYFRPAIRSFLRELTFFCLGLIMYLFPLTMLHWFIFYFPDDVNMSIQKLIFVFTHYIGLALMFWASLLVCVVILANRYKLTSEYVESAWGIIARKTARVELSSIRTVNVNQGIIERLLGVGAISFSSAGTAGQDVTFTRIKYPLKLQALVNLKRQEIPQYRYQDSR
ncbi:hypothetical protein MNBD_GAMMA12-497 [hydrothermal vent metagenome]|uniref:YdbS-like PH domain-containing protein n=1 Tax=hydrothermal vent metagenome TaxID=652676 RepID=A0A3B0ZFA7_9ZZZZ